MRFDKRLGQYSYLALFLFFLVILAAGCTKPTTVGKDLLKALDGQDLVHTDTITVFTRSVRDDSLLTYGQTKQVVGSMADPLFGRSFAGVFFQVRLPQNNIDLGTGLQLDSAILQMKYDGVYGDEHEAQDLVVYQLTEDMDYLQPYRSYEHFSYDPVEVGRASGFTPSTKDTNLIRIRLNQSFGETLLNQSGTSNFDNNTQFLQFMKGLYLAPDTTTGYGKNIITLDLLSSASNLILYFSNSSADSLSFLLRINPGCAFNLYSRHTYTNPHILQQIAHQVETDSFVYLQGMSGLALRLQFPWLESIGDVNIVRAELVLTQIPDPLDSVYTAPDLIVPRVRLDTAGPYFAISRDEQFSATQTVYSVGGKMMEETEGGVTYNRYRVNLIWELENMIHTKDYERPLYLKVIPSVLSPGRAQFGGGSLSDPNYRMTLHLYYTKN